FLHKLLLKLCNLKTLELPSYLHGYDLGIQLKLLIYPDLEVFKTDRISINSVTCFVENNGRHLKEISFVADNYTDTFEDDSLIFIRKIYKECHLIEFITLEFPPTKNHFIELEKLLRNCKKLKILVLNMYNMCSADGE